MGCLCGGERKKYRFLGNALFLKIMEVQGLKYPEERTQNLFVRVFLNPELSIEQKETEFISETLTPAWEEILTLELTQDKKDIPPGEHFLTLEFCSLTDENELAIGQCLINITKLLEDENNSINEYFPLISVGEKLKIMGAIYLKGKFFPDPIKVEEVNKLEPEDKKEGFENVLKQEISQIRIPKRVGKVIFALRRLSRLEDVETSYFLEIKIQEQKIISEEITGKKAIEIDKNKNQINLKLSFELEKQNIPIEILLYKQEISEENCIDKTSFNLKPYIKKHGDWFEEEIVFFEKNKFQLMFDCRFLYDKFEYRNLDFYPIDETNVIQNPEEEGQEIEKEEGTVMLKILRATYLCNTDKDIDEDPDPFVEYKLNFCSIKEYTNVVKCKTNPIWNYSRNFYLNINKNKLKESSIELKIWDMDKIGSDFMGGVNINLEKCVENAGHWQKDDYELSAMEDKNLMGNQLGRIYVNLLWKPKGMEIKEGEENTFFENLTNLEFDEIVEAAKNPSAFIDKKIENINFEEFQKDIEEFAREMAVKAETLSKVCKKIEEKEGEQLKNDIITEVKNHEKYTPYDKEILINVVFEVTGKIIAERYTEFVAEALEISLSETVFSFLIRNISTGIKIAKKFGFNDRSIAKILIRDFGYQPSEEELIKIQGPFHEEIPNKD